MLRYIERAASAANPCIYIYISCTRKVKYVFKIELGLYIISLSNAGSLSTRSLAMDIYISCTRKVKYVFKIKLGIYIISLSNAGSLSTRSLAMERGENSLLRDPGSEY